MPYKMRQYVDIRPVLNREQAVSERILQLDADRVARGGLTPRQLLGKYMSYLIDEK